MNKQTEEFRKRIVDSFIKSLEEEPLEWKKNWSGSAEIPFNGYSERKYHGINRIVLQHTSNECGYNDPRWFTFKQVSDMQLKVKRGSHGCKVEYWFLWDPVNKKSITMKEYAKLSVEEKKKIIWTARYYTVFNGEQIEGLAPYIVPEREINPAEVIQTISKNMDVEIVHDGDDKAFYHPLQDKIHLPKPEYFFSDYDYNATALHELGHSTGHEKRLHRDLSGGFGSEGYAREELVAELTSCFMSAELPVAQSQEHLRNHQAYIQSWIADLKARPESFMTAVKQAEEAAAYLEQAAGLTKEKDQSIAVEINKDSVRTEAFDKVSIQAASISNYEGYLVLAKFDRKTGYDGEKIYIGKQENYRVENGNGVYDNRDNSLLFVTENPRMFAFLDGSNGWTISRQEAVDKGLFTEEDYKEYAKLSEGILSSLPKLHEKKFSSDQEKKLLFSADGTAGVTVGPHRFFTREGCLNYYKNALELAYGGDHLTIADAQMLSKLETDLIRNAGFKAEELQDFETNFLKTQIREKNQKEEKKPTAPRRIKR